MMFITTWATVLSNRYMNDLEIALSSAGIKVRRKIEIPVQFRGQRVGNFEADMLVEGCAA